MVRERKYGGPKQIGMGSQLAQGGHGRKTWERAATNLPTYLSTSCTYIHIYLHFLWLQHYPLSSACLDQCHPRRPNPINATLVPRTINMKIWEGGTVDAQDALQRSGKKKKKAPLKEKKQAMKKRQPKTSVPRLFHDWSGRPDVFGKGTTGTTGATGITGGTTHGYFR